MSVKVYKAPRLYDDRGLVLEFSTPHFVVKSQDYDAVTKELEECKAKLKIAIDALEQAAWREHGADEAANEALMKIKEK